MWRRRSTRLMPWPAMQQPANVSVNLEPVEKWELGVNLEPAEKRVQGV